MTAEAEFESLVTDRAKLTIVVCTRNRATLLDELLGTLANQKSDRALFEIIVVDNGSSDRTSQVVQAHQEILGILKYVLETTVGLSFARNRGWRQATGEYIAYVDDDSRIPVNWTDVALEIANFHSPDAFGGPIYPFYVAGKPSWYKDEYGTFNEGVVAGRLNENQYLSGGNMVIRRELLAASGGFAPDLGMSGDNLGYGEETFLFKTLRETQQISVYYDQRLYVHHLVRPDKTKLLHIAKSRIASGRALYRIWGHPTAPTKTEIYRRLFWTTRQVAKGMTIGMLRRDQKKYPSLQNYLIESTFQRFVEIGKFLEMLKSR